MKIVIAFGLFFGVLFAQPAMAWFDGAAPTGGTGSNWSSWSWTQVKKAVVAKIESYFHGDGTAATGSKEAASTAATGNPAPTTAAAAGTASNAAPNGASNGSGTGADGQKYWSVSQIPKNAANAQPVVAPEKNLKTAAPKIREIKVSRVAKPGVPFKDKYLVMGHNHIPVFEFKKFKARIMATHVKRVPLLNVGEEPTLDQNPFANVSILAYPSVPFEKAAVLPTPPVTKAADFRKMLGAPVKVAAGPQKIVIPVLEAEKKVTLEKIAALSYDLKPEEAVSPLPVTTIADEDLKLLRGLILFQKKDQCHIASGLFADLVNSARPEISESARYHLGICLHEMNLPTESLHFLTRVMRGKNPDLAREALKESLEDLQLRHEDELVEAINGMDPQAIPEEAAGQVDYLKAKYDLKKGSPQKALDLALRVPEKNPFYFKAQYVAAVAEYELGKFDSSISRQKEAAKELARKGSDKNLLALFEVNLGRSAFARGRYKDALEALQKVPKESPMWIQALMDMGWVQLQSKDTSGAIGNMHSIQSPYFEGVFKPESYVIRSIGYLNICQYGDAYKALQYLAFKYEPWQQKIEAYSKTHSADQTYQTVVKLLQGKGNQDVDNLPYQAIKEIAHHRDFLNAQEGINQAIDEASGYNFIRGLIEKDRRSLMARRNATINKVAELKYKIKKAPVTPGAMKNYNAWRFELNNYLDFLSVYEFKVKTMKEGMDGITRLMPKAQDRLAQQKARLREDAGRALRAHLLKVAKNLRQALDNNEFLKYEVFAGSGENLRYQMAGGKVGGNSKNSVERKPSGMHWDFDGEFWEDEIGHYRSSLKNNCQSLQLARQKKGN